MDCVSFDLDELDLELRIDAIVFDSRDEDNIGVLFHCIRHLQHVEAGGYERICVHLLLHKHAIAGAGKDASVGCT